MSTGLTLAALQCCFTLTWTVYVAFLPALLAQAGLAPMWLPVLLVADQAVFVLADLAAGVAADRAGSALHRLGPWLLGATAVSAVAFLALPFLAGSGAATWMLVATAVWAISSAALRAPVAALLGQRAARPALPRLLAWWSLGLALASALGPWLTVQLRGGDARLPFVLASMALLAATLALLRVERQLPPPAPAARGTLPRRGAALIVFLAAAAALGLGFQAHAQLNATPMYLRFATAADLPGWLSLFWVAFALALWPAGELTRRLGAVTALGAGAALAALGAALAAWAPAMAWLALGQALSGAAWGVVMVSAWTAAVRFGHTGREGLSSAGLSSLLALAALLRIAVVAAQWPQQPAVQPWLAWLPVALWALAAVLLVGAAQALRSGSQQAAQVEAAV
ncbi:MFS transporter [Ideonella sp. 4Y11]|uniref:MFS transporter n=1 Tax=Ideonella aquatica TaxID=2824119 RepID=A0A940YGV5_9BURK|nr:MFS transporter [Ideonella aquatica]MBQ0958487.1 MFS transporter [Ideonella aquatica]